MGEKPPNVRAPQALFAPIRDGRFCLLYSGDSSPRTGRAFVYVHPFAEEMNKARRMAALQTRALAEAGHAVLQIDLHGCGDSPGDLAEASWSGWIDDIVAAADWLSERTRLTPTLWGLRCGCLLAAEAASKMPAPDLLLWQPVISGKQHLQQFLRLHVAGQMLSGGAGPKGTAELRAQLARGEPVDVAGYRVPPAVASGLESAALAPIKDVGRVAWLEVAADDPPEVAPASRVCIDAWRAAGHNILARAVTGLPFWTTQEIAECPALLAGTLDLVASWSR